MWWPSGERLFDPHKPEQFPRIVAPYKSTQPRETRWRRVIVGSWQDAGRPRPGDPGAGTREINVHSVGNKRELIPN